MLVSRLDFRTAKDFENLIGASETYPKYEVVQKFLNNHAFTAEEFAPNDNKTKESSSLKTSFIQSKPVSASTSSLSSKSKEKRSFTSTAGKSLKCIVCSQSHYLNQCDQFVNKHFEDRFDVVKRNKLCIRCFNPFHRSRIAIVQNVTYAMVITINFCIVRNESLNPANYPTQILMNIPLVIKFRYLLSPVLT